MWLFKAINSIVWSNFSSYRDDQIFDLNKKSILKKKIFYEAVSSSNNDTFAAAISLIRMIYRYFSKSLTKFCGVSYYFSKILTEVVLEKKICKCFYQNLWKKWWRMSVVVTSSSNDDRACHPKLLKTVPIWWISKYPNFKKTPLHRQIPGYAPVLEWLICGLL